MINLNKIQTKEYQGVTWYKVSDICKICKHSVSTIRSRVLVNSVTLNCKGKFLAQFTDIEGLNKILEFDKNDNIYRVYRYTTPDGRVYIGQTCSSLEVRADKNGKGYKPCTKFWYAIQYFGWENIKSEILADGLTKENANLIEQSLIAYYKNKGISLNTNDV